MKWLRYGLMMVVITILLSGCGQPYKADNAEQAYQVVDDLGNVVKLKAKPQRIVAEHFHLDNMLLGIVSQERIVALTTTMDEEGRTFADKKDISKPKRYRNHFSLEQLLDYKPDLIIVRTTIGAEKIKTYRDMGIPVYISEMPMTVEEVKQKIRGIAAVCGEKERGEILVDKMNKVLKEIETRIPKDKHFTKSVALFSKMSPTYGGKNCFWDDLLNRAKLRNAIADIGVNSGELISKETLLKSDPDYFVLSENWELKHNKLDTYKSEFANDPALKHLRAVKNGQVNYLKEKYLYASNQHCVYAIKYLVNMAYGEVFVVGEEPFLKGY